MDTVRIVFSGAKGRMGSELVPALEAEPGIEVVATTDLGDDLAAAVRDHDADVVVDFTAPEAAMPNARAILAAGAHGVIGTTGFTLEDLDALEAEATAAGRALLIAPNFSLGMILLQRFAEEAVKHLPRVEIIETHHEGKLDAPSGTAQRTAERLAAAGAAPGPAGDDPSRGLDVDGVRVHSLRLAGVQARQEVHFAAEGEGLVLRHDAHSRLCYLPGVVAAVRAVGSRVGLIRGLDPILFPEDADA
ncbi:MAG: 4-hydroxy-tetrahydrodipicolinate reductase [Planctomycetota bacterium]|nr:4-hydroxy-tetrahydrodipicolinate reductase [Planctomycetota bacterium]